MSARDYALLYINNIRHEIRGEHLFSTLSDYLRYTQNLIGTKVVCAEGDCGACTVLVGRFVKSKAHNKSELEYQTANSCIQFMGLLDLCHIITVEGLGSSKSLHPIQKSMLENHGAQCGYCTPGFICSIASLVEDAKIENKEINEKWARNYLTGNLCRCTGYEPILKAVESCGDKKALSEIPKLKDLHRNEKMFHDFNSHLDVEVFSVSGWRNEDDEVIEREFFLPTSMNSALKYKNKNPQAKIVSGATDVGVLSNKNKLKLVQKFSLNNIVEAFQTDQKSSDSIEVGAKVSLTDLEEITKTDFREFSDLLHIFASPQIKNHGTLVGNLSNASPIGDTIPFLNVAGAIVVLASMPNEDGKISFREVHASKFIVGYKKLDISSNEIIYKIKIPKKNKKFKLFKTSLRKDLDISQVTFGASYEILNHKMTNLEVAYGGMSEKVERVSEIETLLNSSFDQKNLDLSLAELEKKFKPFSDVRASNKYRTEISKNLLKKFFNEVQSELTHG